MATKQEPKSDTPTYVVMNPLGHPDGVAIITIELEGQKPRYYYEGDTYDGPRPEEFREAGLLVTPKQAERIVEELDREAEEPAAAPEAEGSE